MTDDQKLRWRERKKAELAASTADAMERIKIQASLAADALKALLLANGGAMVALFTFVGNAISKSPAVHFSLRSLHWSFGLFVAGFTLALIAHVLAFLSQDRYFQQAAAEMVRMSNELHRDEPVFDQTREIKTFRQGTIVYAAGLITAVISVLIFAAGCWFALEGVLV